MCDAIGAMGRAKSVVVVGDSRQMPPSRFGGSSNVDDDDTVFDPDMTVFEDLESILSECVESNLPRQYLASHYRSRHEALIAFSNAHFYEHRLTTFPSPHSRTISPIQWRRVDGHFDREASGEDKRTNRLEAESIVGDIIARLNDPATRNQSIGVVTMNIQQQGLVVRLLDDSGHPRVRELLDDEGENGLIVRNLESVQGDERDVIMLSIAFSPPTITGSNGEQTRGRLPLRFGPLNNKGGERRLNVAVTRARSEVVVYCSFDPEEMHLSENPSRGIQLLKEYLMCARDGALLSGDLQARTVSAPDRYRAAVADELRIRGLRVQENLGLSRFRVDLALGSSDSTEWSVAVLMDGPEWASRTTVYDREVLPPGVLTGLMGWKGVARIWLPSWTNQQQEVISDIAALVRSAEDQASTEQIPDPPAAPQPPTPPPAEPAPQTVMSPRDAGTDAQGSNPFPSSPRQQTFEPAPTAPTVGDSYILDDLGHPQSRAVFQQVVTEILAIEAPVAMERLAKIAATRFGLAVVRASRLNSIAATIPRQLVRTSRMGTFVWPPGLDVDEWNDYRITPSDVDRPIDHIAPEEIINAMIDMVALGHELHTDELFRLTATIFGASRVSRNIRERFDQCMTAAVRRSAVTVNEDFVRIP